MKATIRFQNYLGAVIVLTAEDEEEQLKLFQLRDYTSEAEPKVEVKVNIIDYGDAEILLS